MQTEQISDRKRQANRNNAQRSTGPRTPEGKARSRANALKHGLLAETILINDRDPDEEPQDFDDLLSALIDDVQPAGAREQLLVERLAVCYWRLRRAHRFEAHYIDAHRRAQRASLGRSAEEAGVPKPPLPVSEWASNLIRYESLIDRELHRTLQQLDRLQRQRRHGSGAPSFPKERVGDGPARTVNHGNDSPAPSFSGAPASSECRATVSRGAGIPRPCVPAARTHQSRERQRPGMISEPGHRRAGKSGNTRAGRRDPVTLVGGGQEPTLQVRISAG